jgi:hypothetical protein
MNLDMEGGSCSIIYGTTQHLPGGTEENHEKPQSRQSQQSETGTSQIRSANQSAMTLCDRKSIYYLHGIS